MTKMNDQARKVSDNIPKVMLAWFYLILRDISSSCEQAGSIHKICHLLVVLVPSRKGVNVMLSSLEFYYLK